MGQYAEGEIIIETKDEKSADELAEKIQNLDDYIAKKLDGKPFSTSIVDMDAYGTTITIKLSSDRHQNAEWQCQQIFELVKENSKGQIYSFSADIITPENLIYADFDEEGNEV